MSVRSLAVLFLSMAVFALTACGGAAEPEPTTNSEILVGPGKAGITSGSVEYFQGGQGEVQGFFAKPAAPGDYPGVVMIHEWWGLNENIKDMASQLAREGYAVLAVDLFNGNVATDSSQARQQISDMDPQTALANMEAAADYLRSEGSERIGSLGWCFGGGQSMQLAVGEGAQAVPLDATVIYYGQLVTDAGRLEAIKWPVLGIFGDQDRSIPVERVTEFGSALDSLKVENEIYVYPGVGHAFANPSGTNYAAEETMDAWAKTVSFLNKHLKNG